MLPLQLVFTMLKHAHPHTHPHTHTLPKHFQNNTVQTLYRKNIQTIDIMVQYALSIFSASQVSV
jgi:hypothetical protein